MSEGRATSKGPDWVELRSRRSFQATFQLMLAAGVVWEVLTLLIARQAGGGSLPRTGTGRVVFYAFLAAGLVPLGIAGYAYLVRRNFDDARAFVDRRELVLGETFRARVEQRALRSLTIKEMRVALVCNETIQQTGPDGKPKLKQVPLVQKWETLTRDKSTEGARRLTATRQFTIPPEQPASSRAGDRSFPQVRWQLRVVTIPASGPQYECDFPIHVHATASQGFWDEMKSGTRSRIGRA